MTFHFKNNIVDQLFSTSLRLARMKEKNTFEHFQAMRNSSHVPNFMQRSFTVDLEDISGRHVWTIAPKRTKSRQSIFYLHGGAYVANFTLGNWFFIASMVHALQCTVIAPDYPLAPEHQVDDVMEMLLTIYKSKLTNMHVSEMIIMGDSAGGGLSLAFSQLLSQKGLEQFLKIYLLSPWLDVRMDNPNIKIIDNVDPILNVEALIQCGKAYAGKRDTNDPLVSPIYGSFNGLTAIEIFSGTHDVLMPDAKKMSNLDAMHSFNELSYHEFEGLLHCGMFFPTPIGRRCKNAIFEKLKEDWNK